MRYGFTRSVARIEIATGVLIIVAGAVLAVVSFYISPQLPVFRVGSSPREELIARVLVGVALFGTGVLVGTVLIVSGQVVLVFLDIRARLARIDRRLRRWEEASTDRESPVSERLRPRSP